VIQPAEPKIEELAVPIVPCRSGNWLADLGGLSQTGANFEGAAAELPLPELPLLDDMRVDLAPRSPAEIARLLEFETEEQTARRIANDHERYRRQRARTVTVQ
jgi:hypothetical protein